MEDTCYLYVKKKKIFCTCYAAQYLLTIQIIGLILSLKGIYTNIIKAINGALSF